MSIVTICIPVFNEAKNLPKILKQIQNFCKNINIIVSDNASTDESTLIIKNYKKKLVNLKYFKLEKNFGFDYNYLNCIKRVNTKYFWVIGADDRIYSNSIPQIEKAISLLNNPDGITFVDNKNIKNIKNYQKKDFRKINIDYEAYSIGKISLNVIKTKNFITKTKYLSSNFGYIQVYYILNKIIKNKNWFIVDKNLISKTNYISKHFINSDNFLKRLDNEIKGYFLKIKQNFNNTKNFKKYKKLIFLKNIRPWIIENLRISNKKKVLFVLNKNRYLLNDIFDFWILEKVINTFPNFLLKIIIYIKRTLIK